MYPAHATWRFSTAGTGLRSDGLLGHDARQIDRMLRPIELGQLAGRTSAHARYLLILYRGGQGPQPLKRNTSAHCLWSPRTAAKALENKG